MYSLEEAALLSAAPLGSTTVKPYRAAALQLQLWIPEPTPCPPALLLASGDRVWQARMQGRRLGLLKQQDASSHPYFVCAL